MKGQHPNRLLQSHTVPMAAVLHCLSEPHSPSLKKGVWMGPYGALELSTGNKLDIVSDLRTVVCLA